MVALSKSNNNNGVLSLAFNNDSSVEFGVYSDLVHESSFGKHIVVELGLRSGTVSFGFGQGKEKAGISELDLEYVKIHDSKQEVSSSTSQTINISVSDSEHGEESFKELNRLTKQQWSVHNSDIDTDISYLFSMDGVLINSASQLTGTVVPVDEAVPGFKFKAEHLASLLRSIHYLRPDRVKPLRTRDVVSSAVAPSIDDWGQGTDWFIHKNRDLEVDTIFLPDPSTDKEENKKILENYSELKPDRNKLLPALTRWLHELGLASSLDVKLLEIENKIQIVTTPKGQTQSRPLTDVGFGISQVLPILAKGLTLEKSGLLIVEQPEAQLHPNPQAILADFFCSMVKCTRNVIVETHSVEFFHRLRLRAAMDEELAEKICVYFLNEPVNGACGEPIPISLSEEAELKWPKGFLPEGIQKEMEILATRLARREKES